MSSLAHRYAQSLLHLHRAEQTIPLGSQTFSKSRKQFPPGAAPLFAVRSQGSRTWDIDGNEYVDLVSSLGAVILGYGDDEIHEAVTRQLRDGVSLSLAHPLEAEVSERIVELVPCAEMVRFGKTGSDATAAAIRLARAATGRDHVIVCGYHGWHDWFIGTTTMNLGVPNETSQLTHAVPYNDLEALGECLSELPGEVAALIMEPMTSQWPNEGYLEAVRTVTREHGVLLVFDEMLTGFRFAPGGAQEYFGVTPDLATFGKALGNGFPISAIVGRRELLELMPNIFFSGTHGGETLSLAAARIVLDRVATGAVTRSLTSIGERLLNKIEGSRSDRSRELLTFVGHPTWLFLDWSVSDPALLSPVRTLFLQEMLRRGVLIINTHDQTTAFDDGDIELVADAYAGALECVDEGLTTGDLFSKLQCRPIDSLFSIRS